MDMTVHSPRSTFCFFLMHTHTHNSESSQGIPIQDGIDKGLEGGHCLLCSQPPSIGNCRSQVDFLPVHQDARMAGIYLLLYEEMCGHEET